MLIIVSVNQIAGNVDVYEIFSQNSHKMLLNSSKVSQKFNLEFFMQKKLILTRVRAVFPFYTPWKHQKIYGFLLTSGGVEREY